MNDIFKKALSVAKDIQDEVPKRGLPPAAGIDAESDQVIAFSLLKGTRGYIEKTANQINGCYENGWFDACAVMIRRLIETLIIESFEFNGISGNIKNANGDFFQLSDLIDCTLSEKLWNISRPTKSALPKLKRIGDLSAHGRRYNAHRSDIEKIIGDLRLVVQELVYLSGLK